MWLILLGAPGAGKGTQAQNIMQRLSIPSVSTGNILREAIQNNTELGKKADTFMKDGKLVPDELVIELVKNRIKQDDCASGGCIFDGFPRTVAQAEALDKIVDIDCVLLIRVSDDEIKRRMNGRRVCKICGSSYHVTDKPPLKEGICDKCGVPLSIRDDDDPETVIHRLEVYHAETEPLIKYYARQGKLKTVYAQQDVRKTTQQTMIAIGLESEKELNEV